MMVLRNHNVYGFGSERSSGRIGPVRRAAGNDACGPLTTEVNRKEGSSAALTVATDWRSLFGLTLSGRWSRAIEWRGSTLSSHSGRGRRSWGERGQRSALDLKVFSDMRGAGARTWRQWRGAMPLARIRGRS